MISRSPFCTRAHSKLRRVIPIGQIRKNPGFFGDMPVTVLGLPLVKPPACGRSPGGYGQGCTVAISPPRAASRYPDCLSHPRVLISVFSVFASAIFQAHVVRKRS